jgi:hypothetical protein
MILVRTDHPCLSVRRHKKERAWIVSDRMNQYQKVGGGGATMCLGSHPVTLELPLSSPRKGRKKKYVLPSEESFAGRGPSQKVWRCLEVQRAVTPGAERRWWAATPEANLGVALVGLKRRLSSQGQGQGQHEKCLTFLETQQDGRVLRNREAQVSLPSKNRWQQESLEKIDAFGWDFAFLDQKSIKK